METFQQLKHNISQAWEQVSEGWEKLTHKAASAITRFTGDNSSELCQEQSPELARRNLGWGVMAAEVFDDGDKIIASLEAPGLDIAELDLQVIDDRLIVSGEKKIQKERTEGHYHIKECAYGRFERAIELPDEVDTAKAQAEYKNGILRVELPKAAHKRRKIVKVQVSPAN
ncbi:Molecular chaperone [Candidatus Methylobacter favarea]|uniref:Molecular chaperone n=1 Tax=Candidatus Methylobacter favarea TaxID=2707345 RepID=A0A8S0WGJ7_9GAMM|nr:Hsp20/alpha crystallin family protein [Candidatus Methylobacter favarea]CAA9889211.1 Molecular chaperone [Candidatus Methylobacter favarea]